MPGEHTTARWSSICRSSKETRKSHCAGHSRLKLVPPFSLVQRRCANTLPRPQTKLEKCSSFALPDCVYGIRTDPQIKCLRGPEITSPGCNPWLHEVLEHGPSPPRPKGSLLLVSRTFPVIDPEPLPSFLLVFLASSRLPTHSLTALVYTRCYQPQLTVFSSRLFYWSFPSSPSVATSSLIQIRTLVSPCVPCLGLDCSAATLTTWQPHTNPYHWSSTRLVLPCFCLFDLPFISTPASYSLPSPFRQITSKIDSFAVLRIRTTTLIYSTSTTVTWARHCFPVRPNNLANPKVHPQATSAPWEHLDV